MSLFDHVPAFSIEDAIQFAQKFYALQVRASPLPSERDQNFLLQAYNGDQFVLKIANATEERAMLEAQNQVMQHLKNSVSFCPGVVPTANGEEIVAVESANGEAHFLRLITYLVGTPLGNVKRHSPELMQDLGFKLGLVTEALRGFDHPAFHRNFHWDLANGLDIVRKYEAFIQDPELRQLIQRFQAQFEQYVVPLLSSLRQSVIHNDANNFNLLTGGGDDLYTRDQSIVGLIDYGDMVYSYTVGDLAVAIAYAILDKPDPLAIAAQIIRGFQAACPLTDDEFTALFGLVAIRLCMSACIAADQQSHQPDNEYLSISQASIRTTLPMLAAIQPNFAESVFREACGLSPFSDQVAEWLKGHPNTFASLLDSDLWTDPPAIIDLSVSSSLLSSDPLQNDEPNLTPRIRKAIQEVGATVGIGRYNEARYLYVAQAFATGDQPTDEYRTIHLGIDLFVQTNTPVYAPLDGNIFAFADNAAYQDYGPIIVLEHKSTAHPTFYTLYGHLSRESLHGLTIGQNVVKGQRLATVGSPEVNGGWTPHLHFQIVTDLLNLGCDFPGVARPTHRNVWLSLCPDPNLVLGISPSKFPAREPTKAETLAARRKHLGRNLSISYREPLKIVRGWKQYLFDDEGHKYLDAYNNVAHVGHSHPRVVAAAQRQTGILNTNTRYLHDNINLYAEKLTSLLPESLSVCFFVSSGSEANELAVRLARAYTHQRELIVLEAAYHGNTNTLIEMSPYKHNGPGGQGAPAWVHTAPIPDDYRGPYKRNDPQAGAKYARHVLEIINQLREKGNGPAGFIAESLPSVGGQIILPAGYLAAVYRYMREAGGVCIADEVQTGFGRIGTHFWGFETQDVIPDIVVLGKPIGNGHPLGAVITTPLIADAFNNGMEYFSTFGGNPVSCAIGLEVLSVVQEENLQEHALRVGNYLIRKLCPLIDRYPIVGDVRGSGLFLGVELVRDRGTLEPAAEEASFISNRMREHGILAGTDGPYHNVLKIRPPMPFDERNAEFLVAVIEKILNEDFS